MERVANCRDLTGVHDLVFRDVPAELDTVMALADSAVDVGFLFNTQGVFTENNVVILTGNGGAQPTAIIVPIASVETAAYRGARLTDPLNAVTARLAMEELRGCDTRLDDGAALEDVARAWPGKNPGN